MDRTIAIGMLARRTGVAVSALRHYEAEGLLAPERNAGGQRRFLRSDIRRVSFILIAQRLGLALSEIRTLLEALPKSRTPTQADWTRLSIDMRAGLDARIRELEQLRDRLDGCIGCGCLSLATCALYNPQDQASASGAGPRYLLGEDPPSATQRNDAAPPRPD